MKYVVDIIPANKVHGTWERIYYVHKEGFPNIPVFGSIGTKNHAVEICKQYNIDGKVHYARR